MRCGSRPNFLTGSDYTSRTLVTFQTNRPILSPSLSISPERCTSHSLMKMTSPGSWGTPRPGEPTVSKGARGLMRKWWVQIILISRGKISMNCVLISSISGLSATSSISGPKKTTTPRTKSTLASSISTRLNTPAVIKCLIICCS